MRELLDLDVFSASHYRKKVEPLSLWSVIYGLNQSEQRSNLSDIVDKRGTTFLVSETRRTKNSLTRSIDVLDSLDVSFQ